jgi:hypothetical protein
MLLLLLLTRWGCRCCCQSSGEKQTTKALTIAALGEHLVGLGAIDWWRFRTTNAAKYSALLYVNQVGHGLGWHHRHHRGSGTAGSCCCQGLMGWPCGAGVCR